MPHPRFTNQEIAHKGEGIYAVRLRDTLEKDCFGQVVIIDVETGEYEIGPDSLIPTLWSRTTALLPNIPARRCTAFGLGFLLWKA